MCHDFVCKCVSVCVYVCVRERFRMNLVVLKCLHIVLVCLDDVQCILVVVDIVELFFFEATVDIAQLMSFHVYVQFYTDCDRKLLF